MKSSNLNYRHLYYFWVTAKEGGVTRAAERIGVAVQTISMQLSLLEKSIGKVLFMQQGRRLVLTEAGRVALEYADQIFLLGEKMREVLSDNMIGQSVRLIVGVSDSIPKAQIFNLIRPAMDIKGIRLECYEGSYSNLLADLALHKLDIVFGQKPANISENMKFFSYDMGSEPVWLYGVEDLANKYKENFPACLNGAPMLMPMRTHAVRIRLEGWFESNNIRPTVVGEFSDSATLKTFARYGYGMFYAPKVLDKEMYERYHAVPIAEMEGLEERYYAVLNEQRVTHPAIERILHESRKVS